MSSKGSFFLTEKGDHWYEDFSTTEKKGKQTNTPNVHISIGKEDIISFVKAQETYFFEIDGDSELANKIRNCQG